MGNNLPVDSEDTSNHFAGIYGYIEVFIVNLSFNFCTVGCHGEIGLKFDAMDI